MEYVIAFVVLLALQLAMGGYPPPPTAPSFA
jgi:hypothetical protein